ncbi:hypothetical protein PoB_000583200 [Plakobranchus ocellatus]|uniref:Uncharacterized protein n=1 Tax=Plakobranchus ocellatus TaxID=259542 RepID=A0AAV3YB46_9GAST|nr:hypothetical protein PoB_000583200 [Plakobranchus ocellatus]
MASLQTSHLVNKEPRCRQRSLLPRLRVGLTLGLCWKSGGIRSKAALVCGAQPAFPRPNRGRDCLSNSVRFLKTGPQGGRA